MIVGMSVVSALVVPVGASVVTSVVMQLTVGPRLAARSRRILAAHSDRDEFGARVLDLLALCGNVEGLAEPEGAGEGLSPGLEGERERWVKQIDEITLWLADHWQRFALTYAGVGGLRDAVARYAAAVRGVWLSDRPVEERARMVRELTEPVQTLYFASRWRVLGSIATERARLVGMLDSLKSGPEVQSGTGGSSS
jgi:hypothetical protein